MAERKKRGPKPGSGPNLVGKTFNSWLVLERAPNLACSASLRWRCRCKCGHEQDCFGSDLGRGYTKQCATCAAAERAAKRPPSNRKKWPSEYIAWVNMKSRCYDKNQAGYPIYGGRGITVADEWRAPGGFSRFLDHIGPKPSPKHSIDRIDNDGNYEPGNVRWLTKHGQQANTSRTIKVGDQALAAACRDRGLSYQTVKNRVSTLGWNVEDALSEPLRPKLDEPGPYQESKTDWQAWNRAQKAGVRAEKVKRQDIADRDGKFCRDCWSTDELEVHHIHPLSKGGAHVLTNLCLLCRHCNATRKDHGG